MIVICYIQRDILHYLLHEQFISDINISIESLMATDDKEIDKNMADRIRMEKLQCSEKTKLYTRHSMLSAYDQETLNTHPFKKQSDIFNSNMPSLSIQQDGTPFSKMKKLGIKTVISEESNDNNQQNQRFFEQQRALRTYRSQEKLIERHINRRRKIFDNSYCQRALRRRNFEFIRNREDEQIEKNSTLQLIQKIESILPKMQAKRMYQPQNINQTSIDQYFQQIQQKYKLQHITTELQKNHLIPYRIHSTPNTIFDLRKKPKSNKITFSYHNQFKQTNIPTIEEQLGKNSKISSIKEKCKKKGQNIISLLPIQSDNKCIQHINPVYFKLKNKESHKQKEMNVIQNGIQTSKNSSIEKDSRFNWEEINSKARVNNFGKTSINLSVNHRRPSKNDFPKINSFSNVEGSSPSRYFDDDKHLPLGKKISYRSIAIQGDGKNQNEEEDIIRRVNPRDLFIDFDCRHSEQQQKKQYKKNSALKADMNPSQAILQHSTIQISYQKQNNYSLTKILPTLLILLSVLLFVVQLSR